MGAQLRVYRRRIKSLQSTNKITKAMELIAASRIAKAQARVSAAKPYALEITSALTSLASNSTLDHPLLAQRSGARRAGVLLITSDRGLAGGYSSNVIKATNELVELLRSEGKDARLYVVGRKGVAYYAFRQRKITESWTGFSEQPSFEDARRIGRTLVAAFLAGADDTAEGPGADGIEGVDELHVVYTEFRSMLTQTPVALRIAPLVVQETSAQEYTGGPLPEYEYEPDAEALLESLLPKYINTRIYTALLDAAASESAARRRAMKSAADNADGLIKTYIRLANKARQAEITQEISEIVGGAEALASAGSDL
ncbi:MAG: synthase subunit gamma [Pseudonocardiales bacterium]|nr:synthase subunit gamma [Pseudonocardiales bacterium]